MKTSVNSFSVITAVIPALLLFPQIVLVFLSGKESPVFVSAGFYTCFDDASWAVLDSKLSNDVLGSDRQGVYDAFMENCKLAAGDDASEVCDDDDEGRLNMNIHQPASVYNFTEVGFKKVRAPDDLMELVYAFWENNKGKGEIEWGEPSAYHNTWDTEPTMTFLEDTELEGGGYPLRAKVADSIRDVIEEWTGMQQAISSVYGIRAYHEGSILAPHVDRLPLVSSAILNVAQDVDEDWPLEVYDHNGVAHNITMEPGDLVLYESHSIIHGRPFALKGRYYASIFIHFEPIGPLNSSENVEVFYDNIQYPPYLIPDSYWAKEEWLSENENGWDLLNDVDRLFSDGDLKTIRYAAQLNPDILYGSEELTSLHQAVRHGHFDIVKYLVLEEGIDINTTCTTFDNLLPIDVARNYLHDYDPIIAFLDGLHMEKSDASELVDPSAESHESSEDRSVNGSTENLTTEL